LTAAFPVNISTRLPFSWSAGTQTAQQEYAEGTISYNIQAMKVKIFQKGNSAAQHYCGFYLEAHKVAV